MKRFAFVTWAPHLRAFGWLLEPVGNLPALIDGMSLYLTRLHG